MQYCLAQVSNSFLKDEESEQQRNFGQKERLVLFLYLDAVLLNFCFVIIYGAVHTLWTFL
jgi:uncharacterized ion transporter superfamily protein YfcC